MNYDRFCFTEWEYRRAVVRYYRPSLRRAGYWFGKFHAFALGLAVVGPFGRCFR